MQQHHIKYTGIIKTMPMQFFKDFGGVDKFHKEFHDLLNNPRYDGYWYFSLSGQPKYDIAYIYILFDGAIRYRANIMDYMPAGEMMCASGMLFGKAWARVTAPVVKIDPIPMKGFQGFRYTTLNLTIF